MNELLDNSTYDLIVVGAGPAGLMAAKTAAIEGLRVILVEKKRTITDINRTCAQTFFSPDAGLGDRFYAETVNLEKTKGGCDICYPSIDLRVGYSGPVVPSYQVVYLSPSGYAVKRYVDARPQPWATIISKKSLLAGLLSEVTALGVKVVTGAAAVAAENVPGGVRVLVRRTGGQEWLKAGAAVAADGLDSVIAESLGMNASRFVIGRRARGVQWVMEGVHHEFSPEGNPCFIIAVPKLRHSTVMVGPYPEPGYDGLTSVIVTSGGEDVLREFVALPRYCAWFQRARLLKRTAYTGQPRSAVSNPVSGRVLVVGDAAAAFETLITGALACGYQAARAVARELDDRPGYEEYGHWWLRSFHFHESDYYEKIKVSLGIPLVTLCDDGDIDYLYSRLSGCRGDPARLVLGIMDMVRDDRPDLYARLTAGEQRT